MKQPEYTISMISDILNISPQTIRLYEQNGIVRSNKHDENGYRYFNRIHVNVLTWARSYRALGFTMEDTARLLNECDAQEAVACYARREEEMEREIELARLKRRLLGERRALVQEAMEHLGEIDMRSSPDCYVCHLMERDQMTDDEQERACARAWSGYMPFVWPVGMMPQQRLHDDSGTGSSKRMIRAEYAQALGLELLPPAEHIPSRRCVHTFFSRQGQAEQSFRNNLAYVAEYIRQEGLSIAGDVMVEPLLILRKTSEHILYAQAFFPVSEQKT